MANSEHLAILKQGVEAWNKWREANPANQPDLYNAELRGSGLSGFDFSEADLEEADLSHAELTGAILFKAHLREADLSHAKLDRANLSGALLHHATLHCANLRRVSFLDAVLYRADLSGVDLRDASLSPADLTGTNLSNADLRCADLRFANLYSTTLDGAQFGGTNFGGSSIADVDLSEAQGLEIVVHRFPSSVGIDTIYKSKGKIPEVFLRGCGVPEELIAYIPSLIGAAKPIEFYSAFISYSSKDDEFARRLHSRLRDDRVRVWFAPEDLKIGEKFRVAIDEAIRVYDKLMVVLSAASVQSDWVEKEVEAAMEKERKEKRTVLFPLRLDDAVMDVSAGWAADIRRTRNIGDFRKWEHQKDFEKAYARLLRDLSAENPAKT